MNIRQAVVVAGLVIGTAASNVALASYEMSDPLGGDITRIFGLDSTGFYSGEADDNADSFIASGSGNITLSGAKEYVPLGWTGTYDSGEGGSSSLFNVYQDDSVSVPAEYTESSRGRFEIDAAAWTQYSAIAIGLKVGENFNPDWAIFEVESKAQFGNWFTFPSQGGGLSHFLIYTKTGGNPPSEVPLPSAFWLLGSSLLGLVGVSRKNAFVRR